MIKTVNNVHIIKEIFKNTNINSLLTLAAYLKMEF